MAEHFVDARSFDAARELLEKTLEKLSEDARRSADGIWLIRQLARCTYQDDGLQPARRFAAALSLLEGIGLRRENQRDADTLLAGGDLYMAKWEMEGQTELLHESLAFYTAAHRESPRDGWGSAGLGAAFVCDILANRLARIETRNGVPTGESDRYREKAKLYRTEVRDLLAAEPEKTPAVASDYAFLAAIAEAQFGLGAYQDAGGHLEKASGIAGVAEWQRQATFRRLVALADLQGLKPPAEGCDPQGWDAPWKALERMLGEDTPAALGCHRGKIGMALSGGGFRASLFHLGVLARLAEVDALRGVEVLSTVSGGSIVGAHYYLELQKLLESTPDRQLSRDDYIAIVRQLQDDFLQGVQHNVRMQSFANFFDTLRMLFSRSYSRSHKLGEMYEEALYSRVDGRASPRTMEQLLIRPLSNRGEKPQQFSPKSENWRRNAKVPILLLNTTSLNSGHNWFFTATWMGEPPGLVGEEIDNNPRYRRLYYFEAPSEGLRNFRLGHAVAASSCVPGLFEPLVIDGLYPGTTVRLVDGGVHDNQGVQGLLDEGCDIVLCSDASGQMGDVADPKEDPAGVLLRTVSVLQDRVREAQYQDLRARADSRALQGLMFVHSKKELVPQAVTWNDTAGRGAKAPAAADETSSYGINKRLQLSIASLRTDLDAFTEVEAYSLMASGYLMTASELNSLQRQHARDGGAGTWGGFRIDAPRMDYWPFLPLLDLLGEAEDGASECRKDLQCQLDAGGQLFLKAWRLVPQLRLIAFVAGVAAAAVLAGLLWGARNAPVLPGSVTWGAVFAGLLMFLAGLILPALKWLNPAGGARQILLRTAVSLTGYLLGKVHLWWIDRLYLERGRLTRLLALSRERDTG